MILNAFQTKDLDWASFILQWLLICIKKYRFKKLQGIQAEIGGCKHLLVVCACFYTFVKNLPLSQSMDSEYLLKYPILCIQIPYFEFLITFEFNLGHSLSRLPLWSTLVVNSYIALDSVHGIKRGFGRLAVSAFPYFLVDFNYFSLSYFS